MSRRRKQQAKFSLFSFQDIITSVTGIMILITLVLALELLTRTMHTPAQQTVTVIDQLEDAVTQNLQAIEELETQQQQGSSDVADLVKYSPEDLQRRIRDVQRINEAEQQELAELQQQESEVTQQERDITSQQQKRASDPQTIDQLNRQLQEKKEKLKKIKQSNRVVYNPVEGSNKTPWLVEITGQGFSVAQIGKTGRPQTFGGVGQFTNWLGGRNPGREYFVLLIKPDGIESYRQAQAVLDSSGFEVGFDVLSEDQNAIDPETGAGS